MTKKKTLSQMSVDEIIDEAVRRERALMEFYHYTLCEVGPDACDQMKKLVSQQEERIHLLEKLRDEVNEQRNLTIAIAD